MTLAHTLYKEIVPAVLQVELKRENTETPFPVHRSIRVVYGIPVLVQILTALGKGYAGAEPVFLLFRRVQPPFCPEPSSEGLPAGAGRNGSRSGPRAPGDRHHKKASCGDGHVCRAVDPHGGGIFKPSGL